MSDNLKERESFEAWYEAYCMPGESDWFRRDPEWPDEYEWTHTSEAWAGWKARAAIESDRVSRDVPAGWKLVPVEPTEAMLEAARTCHKGRMYPQDDKHGPAAVRRREFVSMLAAAPQPQPVQAQPSTCTWTYQNDDSGNYESSCGELWHFIDGGPNENRVTYCHHCGKPVAVKEE